ncbi:MAG: T9SS C-terminal target domain-containing protein [Bacteroidetes bacterium]|nr:MAG: T9SS C-terminal target domain-containing protein [Bacteroidota bacterium]REK33679.1 MAG: T9SS C-terminal target domain-containing protein [Bacteroidota bacterium]REK47244.1 MAG: T9SS C-terminal target domain-containing protein [Bacteroidota bacterium]
MKKIYAILFVVIPVISNAQVSLNSSLAPSVNSMLFYHDANVPSPPFTFSMSGTGNTWDFSSLFYDPIDEDTVYFVHPSTIPGGSFFTSATHATRENDDEDWVILQVTPSALIYQGLLTDITGNGNLVPVPLNPPSAAMNFPYTYGSSVNMNTYYEVKATGADIGQPQLDSVKLKSTLIMDADVIASGTIILPSGSFPSILERKINTTIDTAWMKGASTGNQWVFFPGFPETYVDSAFYWYGDQSLQHIAHALFDDTGLHDVHFLRSSTTVGIHKPTSSQGVSAYPNPATNILGINGFDMNDLESWTIINESGQEVMKGKKVPGKIVIHQLSQGSYFLVLRSAGGESKQVRFVKN